LTDSSLLKVENLKVEFDTGRGRVVAVDGVDLILEKEQTLGIVGESGCGKSVTGLSIMGLLSNNARSTGKIMFEGENLLEKNERQLTSIRGNKISMIFQEPMTSLNPVFTIQDQLGEVFCLHKGMRKKELRDSIIDSLRLVGIPNPERRMKDYPHRLSGGMRQRVMIAMALACNPDILIADEPTTALDVTIQAQILVLIRKLQEELNTGVIMITHDLGVVAQVAHMVAVMYAGQVVEYAAVGELFDNPLHPYTRGLLKTIPSVKKSSGKLDEIEGTVPDLGSLPGGCRFHPRCRERIARCSSEIPEMTDLPGRKIRCWLSA
jgi:peptide/nickel transport system ATP-binding protein